MDTRRARNARELSLTADQFSVVVGSLLGDGYLVATTRGYAFRVNHGLEQREYVDWKYEILKDFTNSAPRQSANCYYFRTVSHRAFGELYAAFYNGGRNRLPSKLPDWLNAMAFAVWVMDDGAKDGSQLRINSQSFSRDENEWLVSVLEAKLGVRATLNRDKDRYRLRVRAASMQTVKLLVAPYIIPSMLYKLSL